VEDFLPPSEINPDSLDMHLVVVATRLTTNGMGDCHGAVDGKGDCHGADDGKGDYHGPFETLSET
jgi:hypothetical protein